MHLVPNYYRLVFGMLTFVLSGSVVLLWLDHSKWDMVGPPLVALCISCIMLGVEVWARQAKR